MTLQTLIDELIEREGGFVDDPEDRGGATKFGITHLTLASFRKRQVSKDDVKNLSKEEAVEIYNYLFKTDKLNLLPEFLHAPMFDFVVHSGPKNPIKILQSIVGVVEDGKLGPETAKACGRFMPEDLLFALAKRRILFLIRLTQKAPGQIKFLAGWIMRVLEFLR